MEFSGPDREAVGVRWNDVLGETCRRPQLSVELSLCGDPQVVALLGVGELAVEGAVKHYREFLLGKDPRRLGALWQEMYRSQYFEGGRVLSAAISAI